jgi:hypothetical protein
LFKWHEKKVTKRFIADDSRLDVRLKMLDTSLFGDVFELWHDSCEDKYMSCATHIQMSKRTGETG